MTVAPKLQKGLKRLFSSSILRIIASVLLVISLIVMIGGLAVAGGGALASTDEYVTGGLIAAGSGAILTLVAGILVVIAFILSLVGIINVSKENGKFKIALYAVLAGIVLSIVNGFFANSATIVPTILTLLVNICDIVMFLFTCKGIQEVGEKLGRDDIAGKYNSIVIFYCLAAVLRCIGGALGLEAIGYTFNLIGVVCSIIAYFMYMGYLRKAIKALEGVPTAEQA